MTYSHGNPGYQPAPPPGGYGSPNPSFAKPGDSASRLPQYLQVGVVTLGLLSYLASFGPMLSAGSGGQGAAGGRAGFVVPLAVVAALLAAVGLLPKAKNYTPIVAVLAGLAALSAIKMTLTRGDAGWALWLVLALVVVQAALAVGVLLLDAGVITAPAPRPKYDPYTPYGLPPGGGYYGRPVGPGGPGGPGGHPGRGHQQGPQQPGYPSYGGYPAGPVTGGFSVPPAPSTGGYGAGSQPSEPQGPPTPPTGFPSFSPPPSGVAATGTSQGSTSSGQGQQPQSGQSSPGSSASPAAPPDPAQP